MVEPLAGFTVGITGHRRWEEQAELLTRRGARVVHGPTMTTSLLGDSDATLAATRDVLARPLDLMIFTTGIGVRSWFSAAESWGSDEALREHLSAATVVTRGPKAASAVRAAGLEVSWMADTETNDEVVTRLSVAGVSGLRVAVQRDGGEPLVADAVRALGADVVDVPVYAWDAPADSSAATKLLDATAAERLDAVTFTCSYAVRSAFDLARDPESLRRAFASHVRAVAVGPVTAESLRAAGVARIVAPRRARLGSMIHALTAELVSTHRVLRHDGHCLRWQGALLASDDDTTVDLTAGERKLLRDLLAKSPAVVAKAELVEDTSDDHAVEAAVARLRSKLGPLAAGISSVRRRGYACSIEVCTS